jgi:hypothetical protein
VTNTETAVVPYPVEAAMEAVSAMMTPVSAAVSAASGCDGRRESNDRGSDGKRDGRFSKHRSVSCVGHPPAAMLVPAAEAKLNIGSRMREVGAVTAPYACFRRRCQVGVSK